jgi:hypothetical protein
VIEPRPELSGDAETDADPDAEANIDVETNTDVGVALESETVNEIDPSITLKMSEPLRRDAPQPAQTPVILVR